MLTNSILVVDDDSDDRFLMNSAFKDLGHPDLVSFAESGEKAMQYLATSASLPLLVVLDLNMPKMTGTQVLKAIKDNNNYNNIRVLMFSTAINDHEKNECLSYGAINYMVKPINYGGFLETAQSFYDIVYKQ